MIFPCSHCSKGLSPGWQLIPSNNTFMHKFYQICKNGVKNSIPEFFSHRIVVTTGRTKVVTTIVVTTIIVTTIVVTTIVVTTGRTTVQTLDSRTKVAASMCSVLGHEIQLKSSKKYS